jgi:nifR3 family TIM-barrel protein
MANQTHPFLPGNFNIAGNLVLAPMDGYSDWPFRSLCRELGSAISYTEFVKAEDVLDRPHYIEKKLYFTEEERPVFFQLYGHDSGKLLAAALQLQALQPDAIDINLGCPNRSISGRGAGAGLMRTPLKVARIFRDLSQSLDLPLTGKIRLGWRDCQNQVLIARIIAEFGGSLLAVHARTKEQGHLGEPDWEAIAEIKNEIDIPVLGNGGVNQVSDIQKMIRAAKCDGVMIGRSAIKNPWIFSGLDRKQIAVPRVQDLFLQHLDRSLSFYGREDGLIFFRKFAAGYLEPYQLEREQRKILLMEKDVRKFTALARGIFRDLDRA